MRLASAAIVAGLAICACYGGDDAGSDDAGPVPPADAGPGLDARVEVEPEVLIGLSGDAASLEFVPLDADGDVPLQSFGQGGTHAAIALRCIGFGKRAFIVVTLENLESGETVVTPEPRRPQLLLCRDEAETICDLIPLYVLTGGLADPSEKDGLHIRIRADVHNAAGVEGSASADGFLRADFD